MKTLVYRYLLDLAKDADKTHHTKGNMASVSIIQRPGSQPFVSLRPGHSGQPFLGFPLLFLTGCFHLLFFLPRLVGCRVLPIGVTHA
jgi:hypothetical protein